MARKAKKTPKLQNSVAELEPSELSSLKESVKEFVTRYENIENEIRSLSEDKATLIEEFSDRIDIKTLKAALKVLKIESAITYRTNYEAYYEVLKDDSVNGLTDE